MKEIKEQLKSFIHDLDVLLKADEFIQALKLHMPEVNQVQEALVFAAKKHRNQVRKNGKRTPYIIHPIGVARCLFEIGGIRDPEILCAALLHDTVEDTNTTLQEIGESFGQRIAALVDEVTDDKTLPKARRKELQIEKAPYKTIGAVHIKLADALYNLNDLVEEPPIGWSRIRQKKYCDWAEKVITRLPDANPPLKEKVQQSISHFRELNL